ncbi:FAD-dependent oxidoreductase [Asanoa sp. WMMD1127]|uniref:FAD-dependent oxidoreductase n=1 Tax=Asanoa sp. WMMD1127 TaxID=3016107 RepID=UPI0024171003|nr:FAD-dependent oxidoreductase [Asanoa sp. WMMD1127]MDG4825069.1 FAD-dependent oxidoreductase [Asanoa sp. WMMD1127]
MNAAGPRPHRAALADVRAQEALRLLGPEPANWVEPAGVDRDVAVVGGGQCGVTIAFALRRAGVRNITVLDAADPAEVGGWRTTARMRVLRTPKDRSGPEIGIPALSFRAWYEASHGVEAFHAVDRIARTDWADYLTWFTGQVGVAVRHRTRLVDIEPARGHLRLHLLRDGAATVETVRKVVLANGVDGTGGPFVPPALATLPRHLRAHTADRIDFAGLAGASVGILGAASSAFDAAATALEAGAAEVRLFCRRPDVVIARPNSIPPNAGAEEAYHLRPDDFRWETWTRAHRGGASVPLEAVRRATVHRAFHLHVGTTWRAVRVRRGKVRVDTDDGSHLFDFVIAGTGYQYDPHTRVELRRIAGDIAMWHDRHPPAAAAPSRLSGYPYVGSGYQLCEKRPGDAPFLRDVHTFTAAASPSFGRLVGDIASLRTGVPRLVRAIVRDLYNGDLERDMDRS